MTCYPREGTNGLVICPSCFSRGKQSNEGEASQKLNKQKDTVPSKSQDNWYGNSATRAKLQSHKELSSEWQAGADGGGGGTPPSDENWMPQHSFREHSKGGLSPILRCEWAAIPAVEIGIAVGARSTGSRGLIEERRNQVYSEPPHY